MSTQCKGVTLTGLQCTRKTKSHYCTIHKAQEVTPVVRNFTVAHADNWNFGPRLNMYEQGAEGYFSDSDDDLPSGTYANVEFELRNSDYHVFHLIIYLEDCEVRPLKTFKTYNEAETYAKQQYFLATENYPFIRDGDSGERTEIPITYTKDVDLVDDDTYEYLIVINKDKTEAHSLNEFAEW